MTTYDYISAGVSWYMHCASFAAGLSLLPVAKTGRISPWRLIWTITIIGLMWPRLMWRIANSRRS